jgi:hypothetical protein
VYFVVNISAVNEHCNLGQGGFSTTKEENKKGGEERTQGAK